MVLAFDAVAPLGKGVWYYASSEHFSSRPVRMRITEHRFEFQDDPLQNDRGRAIVHRCIGDEVVSAPVTFSVKVEGKSRDVSFRNDVVKGVSYNFKDIRFLPGTAWGWARLGFGPETRIYSPAEVKIEDGKLVKYGLKEKPNPSTEPPPKP